jgi:hypothetical protein
MWVELKVALKKWRSKMVASRVRLELKMEVKLAAQMEELKMGMEEENTFHQHRRDQQFLNKRPLRRILCFERMLMQVHNEVERD